MQKINCYGIHQDAKGIRWLMQGRGSTNAIGFRQSVPFRVVLPSQQRHCNHQIPLSAPVPHDQHWEYFQRLLDDDLVWAMLPLPKRSNSCFFTYNTTDDLTVPLILLAKMSSPIDPIILPIDTFTGEGLLKELQQSNLQPLIITGVKLEHMDLLKDIAIMVKQQPRKVLVVAEEPDVIPPPTYKLVETNLDKEHVLPLEDLVYLPWEILGATVIRKYMRKEEFRGVSPRSGVQYK